MQKMTIASTARAPAVDGRVVLTSTDYHELLPLTAASRSPGDAGDLLAEKLEMAAVVEPTAISPAVVTMNTEMEVRDEASGHVARLTLVHPREANIVAGRISVLTPVGVALLGLGEGALTRILVPSGEEKRLTVLRILMQPEARARRQPSAV
jgi:regulator of nucleoside diphosphate kinase